MEHFDREGLLKRVRNNEALYAKLITIAKEDIPAGLEKLEKELQDKNYELLKESGHSLKGTALNMGFDIFADIAYKVEKIEESAYSTLPELISSLKKEYEVVLNYIN